MTKEPSPKRSNKVAAVYESIILNVVHTVRKAHLQDIHERTCCFHIKIIFVVSNVLM
jgi:hypothetical protein